MVRNALCLVQTADEPCKHWAEWRWGVEHEEFSAGYSGVYGGFQRVSVADYATTDFRYAPNF